MCLSFTFLTGTLKLPQPHALEKMCIVQFHLFTLLRVGFDLKEIKSKFDLCFKILKTFPKNRMEKMWYAISTYIVFFLSLNPFLLVHGPMLVAFVCSKHYLTDLSHDYVPNIVLDDLIHLLDSLEA